MYINLYIKGVEMAVCRYLESDLLLQLPHGLNSHLPQHQCSARPIKLSKQPSPSTCWSHASPSPPLPLELCPHLLLHHLLEGVVQHLCGGVLWQVMQQRHHGPDLTRDGRAEERRRVQARGHILRHTRGAASGRKVEEVVTYISQSELYPPKVSTPPRQ